MNSLKKFLFGISKGDILLPKLKAFLRKEQQEIIAGTRSPREAVLQDATLTVRTFKERMETYNHDADDSDATKHYFHPSQIGRCPRELWFDAFDAPSSEESATGEDMLKSFLIFEIGTYAHVMFQNLCSRAGVLARRELPVLDHKLRVIGHCDGKLRIDKAEFALEFKTINDRGFTGLNEPKKEHVWQVHIYMALLGLPAALVVYFNKNSSELKEFRVPFDQVLWEKTIKPRIAAHHAAVAARKMPPRIEDAAAMRFPCAWCKFNRICFETIEQQKFLKSIKAK